MPGLDDSDLIAFLRVIDAPPSDIAARAAGFRSRHAVDSRRKGGLGCGGFAESDGPL